jgi:hypothetical protein
MHCGHGRKGKCVCVCVCVCVWEGEEAEREEKRKKKGRKTKRSEMNEWSLRSLWTAVLHGRGQGQARLLRIDSSSTVTGFS